MIRPTVCRMVHYYPLTHGTTLPEPKAAVIVRVHPRFTEPPAQVTENDFDVCLRVFHEDGTDQTVYSAPYSHAPAQSHWSWPVTK